MSQDETDRSPDEMSAAVSDRRTLGFEELLNQLSQLRDDEGDGVTVRELLSAVGPRAYGPIILLLGFVSISPLTLVPGANWLFALVIILIASQIAVGRPYPWLPKRLLETSFPHKYLLQSLEMGRPWARRVDAFTRLRFDILTEPPFLQLVSLICILAAILIFPLGLIPLGPLLPGIAILLFGAGLAARDGILLCLSGGAVFGSVLLLLHFGGTVLDFVKGWF